MKRALATIVASFAVIASGQGDDRVAQGGRLASQGGGGAVVACASCHGARGEGNAATNFPRLAAQPAEYVLHQLESYASGTRLNAVMQPIASAMTREQRLAAAAYYAQLAAPAVKHASGNATSLARGRTIALVGDEKRQLQACVNCHGPEGRGLPPAFPYLAGQDPDYAIATLADWRSGARNSDPSGEMPVIAKLLGETDAAAVSAFFASRPAPAPVAVTVQLVPDTRSAAAPAASTAGPAPSTGTAGGTPPVGAGQGAATVGGTQGAGGSPSPAETQGGRDARPSSEKGN
jgi:cytochrome c553